MTTRLPSPTATTWALATLHPMGLITVWALLVLSALWLRPLLPIDETRYLSVAWEMWQRGDFLVPYKNGIPYSHKPPLLFWMIHAGWWAFGVNEWWPRLISPLVALANLALVFVLGKRLWPERDQTLRLAPAALLGSLLWIYFGTALMFDMLITCCTLVALLGMLQAWHNEAGAWWLLVGVALGLGILAKGPVILLYTLPPALFPQFWMRERRPLHWSGWYLGLALAVALACALALGWALPAAAAGGREYAEAILWTQTSDRVASNMAHVRPVWWYLAALPLSLLPLAFWPGFWRALGIGVRPVGDSGVRFCLLWAGTGLLLLSAVNSKQPHYLLPLFPALALLFARGAEGLAPKRPRALGLMMSIFAVVLLLLPYLDRLSERPMTGLWWADRISLLPGGILLVLGLTTLFRPRPQQTAEQVAGLVLGSAAIFVALHLSVVAAARPAFDLAPMGQAIQRLQQQGIQVAHFGEYHGQYQFVGRLTAPLLEVQGNPPPGLADWFSRHPGEAVVHYAGDWPPPPESLLPGDFIRPYRGSAAILSRDSAGTAESPGHQTDGSDQRAAPNEP